MREPVTARSGTGRRPPETASDFRAPRSGPPCGYSPHFGARGYSRPEWARSNSKRPSRISSDDSKRASARREPSRTPSSFTVRSSRGPPPPSPSARSTIRLHRLQRGGPAPVSGRERRAAPRLAGPRPVAREAARRFAVARAFREHVARAIANGTERCEWARAAPRRHAVHRRRTDCRPAAPGRPARHADDHRGHHRAKGDGGFAAQTRRARRAPRARSRDSSSRGTSTAQRASPSRRSASLLRAPADTVARWIETTGAPEAGETETDDIALVRLTGEMIAMARARVEAERALR